MKKDSISFQLINLALNLLLTTEFYWIRSFFHLKVVVLSFGRVSFGLKFIIGKRKCFLLLPFLSKSLDQIKLTLQIVIYFIVCSSFPKDFNRILLFSMIIRESVLTYLRSLFLFQGCLISEIYSLRLIWFC